MFRLDVIADAAVWGYAPQHTDTEINSTSLMGQHTKRWPDEKRQQLTAPFAPPIGPLAGGRAAVDHRHQVNLSGISAATQARQRQLWQHHSDMDRGSLTGVSVLVVEDYEDLRDALRDLLEIAGAVVSAATDGAQALEVLETISPPDVILCDLHMPRLDGCRFLSRLRAQPGCRHIPAIALTGYQSEVWLMRSLEAGFSAHLVKPVAGAALYAQLKRVLAR